MTMNNQEKAAALIADVLARIDRGDDVEEKEFEKIRALLPFKIKYADGQKIKAYRMARDFANHAGALREGFWSGLGSWLFIIGLQVGLAIVLYYFLGYYGALLWWPLFLISFYLFQKYNGND